MALMSPTPRTVVLSTRQQQLKVCFCAHVARNCIEKTWPASPTVVLGCRLEQRKIARRANKGPVTFLIIERAGTRWFGGFFKQNRVRIISKKCLPLRLFLVEFLERLTPQSSSPLIPEKILQLHKNRPVRSSKRRRRKKFVIHQIRD